MTEHLNLSRGVANMNKKTVLLLGLIVLGSGLVASLMLTRGHNWGDDYAAYILQAKAIAGARLDLFLQDSTFTIDQSSYRFGPITFPWGFPLLLAPIYALFGVNLLAFKALLTLCYGLFLVAFFFLARTRLSDAESLLLTAFMAFNLRLLSAQNQVLSDLPFLLWSTLGLWLIEKHTHSTAAPGARTAVGVAVGGVLFMAALTRLNGLLLFVPLVVAQFLFLRGQRADTTSLPGQLQFVAVPYVVFALCYAGQALLLPNLGTGLAEQWQTFGLPSFLLNLWYYFKSPGLFLEESMLGGQALYAVLLVFFVLAVAERCRRDLAWILYVLSTLGLYVAFPLTQGTRYIFPILPVFIILSFHGMKVAVGHLPPVAGRPAVLLVFALWAGLTFASMGASVVSARANLLARRQDLEGPFTPGAAPMFDYIREATPPGSVIIFRKPRTITLLTGRRAILATECADLKKGDYVVISRLTVYDQIPLEQIEACETAVSLTRIAEIGDFVIFAISPR